MINAFFTVKTIETLIPCIIIGICGLLFLVLVIKEILKETIKKLKEVKKNEKK